jgi:hypothetical protein
MERAKWEIKIELETKGDFNELIRKPKKWNNNNLRQSPLWKIKS